MIWTTRQRSKAGPFAAISQGKGPLVLLVHGVGLRAEAWGAQIDVLAQTHRVLAVDMPGHGESPVLADDPQLRAFTDAVAAALTSPAVVIGHSFGAMIGLDMAARYPEHVTGVVALNAIYRREAAAKTAVQTRADSLDGLTVADPTATLARWFGEETSPEREACREWLSAVNPTGYRDAYRAFAREDGPMDQTLRDLRCPALFITGAREPNSTPEMSRKMAGLVPDGRAEVLEGAAHMMPMTHSAQVNADLTAFLKRHS
ncbi:MAG TPA: alpha/beta hydrolase [Paracoccaceae bacterium]|nr:alpha/beta hydrolase [Paracoccaceae bacterium]